MGATGRPNQTALRLVTGGAEQTLPVEWAWFCGHCAAPSPRGEAPLPMSRVCSSCGLGLFLEAPVDSAPQANDAFLVIDAGLCVQAMSENAEMLLGLSEEDAVNRPVTELLVPADAEAGASGGLPHAIARAAGDGDNPADVVLRPWNTFGVRMRARIAPCGPPRAALLVLEGGRPRDLRAVDR